MSDKTDVVLAAIEKLKAQEVEIGRLRGEVERQRNRAESWEKTCAGADRLARDMQARAETAEAEVEKLRKAFLEATREVIAMGERAQNAEIRLAELRARKGLGVDQLMDKISIAQRAWAEQDSYPTPHGFAKSFNEHLALMLHDVLPPDQSELVKQLADALVDAKFLIDRHREPETKNFIQEHITGPKVKETKDKIAMALTMAKEAGYSEST